MASDDRPKVSWREIDKLREGSGSRGSGPPSRPLRQEEQAQKQYRAALEAAFAKGELGKLADKLNLVGRSEPREPERPAPIAPAAVAAEPAAGAPAAGGTDAAAPPKSGKKKPVDDKAALRKKLVEAPSRHEIAKAAEKYLARFPLPDDHEFLEQLLDHEEESRVREAIERIWDLFDRRQPPRRSRALSGKLKYITETARDDELRRRAEELLKRLG